MRAPNQARAQQNLQTVSQSQGTDEGRHIKRESSSITNDQLPDETRDLNQEQQKRLRVTWDKPKRTFDGTPVSVAHSLQLSATLLKKKDGILREAQAGVQIVDTPGGATDKTDFGFVAVVSTGDLPGSTESVVWSIQAQLALLKSLTDRAASAQVNPFVEVDVTVFKKADVATIKLTGQVGVVGELDTPGRDNKDVWLGKAGGAAFFGLTVTFGEHEDPKK
jgi:hypothetical protein